jgi:hypothetical protein
MSDALAGAASAAANLAWKAFQAVNTRIPDSPSIEPEWAPGPLPKSYERTKPPLGWPRETDSLCPECVIEVRDAIIAGERDLSELTEKKTGEVKAEIVEEDGKILIKKTCERHGDFWDTLSIDPQLSEVLERRFFGRDFRTSEDEHLHHHGTSTIRYGRGAVLTIDLTNRCNMMCNPCFMDANQVGYVHELTLEEIKKILDDSISFKPRRQMSVQYSGGEPTISPHFLEACRYAHEVGYYSVQAATNGLRFALEPEYAHQAAEAGLNMVYLQFDGVTNESNMHRHISNLFDVRWQAIERLHEAGIDITPVTTVINTINDGQVGPILDFVIQNSDKMGAISFQPVSFTGRDEEISDEDRHKQRYTISHLAHELARHTNGKIDIYRDWYPLGSAGAYTWLADHLRGTEVDFGGLSCSCHPNCGASLMLMVNSRTKEWAPLTQFFDAEQFINDISVITDTSRGKKLSLAQTALALLRNTDPSQMPPGLTTKKFFKIVNSKLGGAITGDREILEWKIVWIGGMWFQDLWTYDFRRTEMCVIPYATQEGEISFCAYNTGAGWRKLVENMHMVAKTQDWFKDKGRHTIYAGDRPMDLKPGSRSLPIVEKQTGPPHAGTVQLDSSCH